MNSRKKSAQSDPLSNWLAHHIFCLLDATHRTWRNLGSSLITIGMIAVSLAIPLTLFSIINPFQIYLQDLDETHRVTFFLTKQVDETDAKKLLNELAKEPYFYDFTFVAADQALTEFAAQTALPLSPELLGENPLPHLLTATANITDYSATQLQQQVTLLLQNPQIEQIIFDYAWLERLQTIVQIAAYIGLFLLVLLSITVILVIINTVRWEIEARRDEFKIIRLVGGTDRYIRRPFLYIGLVTGGLGAVLAVLLVAVVVVWIDGPIEHLFGLYETDSPEIQVNGASIVLTLLLGAGLGLSGAGVAAHHKLRTLRLSSE